MRIAQLMVVFLLAFPSVGMTQTLNLRVSGETTDGLLTYEGFARFKLLSRRATLSVRTSENVSCHGSAKLNVILSAGEGRLSCESGLAADFAFDVTSKFPISGQGIAQLSDGRTAIIRIFK